MRSTVDLPDDLMRHLKARAALEGRSLRDLLVELVELVERGLKAPPVVAKFAPVGLLTVRLGRPLTAATGGAEPRRSQRTRRRMMAARAPRAAKPPPTWGAAQGNGLGGDLPDLNAWLALVVVEHPHHTAARRYWDQQQVAPVLGPRLWFCRSTMLGLVRLLLLRPCKV